MYRYGRILSELSDWGDPTWMGQFIYGFPVVGLLSQAKLYKTRKAPADGIPDITYQVNLFGSATHRFQQWSKPMIIYSDRELWSEATEQHKTGKLGAPEKLGAHGRLLIIRANGQLFVFFRCAER